MQHSMKTFLIANLVCGALSGDVEGSGGSYGPSNCILASRSAAGSCLITTDCKGLDTSSVEFGVSCVRDGKGTQWHSYGNGGFEENEEFDTGLNCDECKGPSIDPINGEVTDDKVPSMDTEMVHVESTPSPGGWVVAPTFPPESTQKPPPEVWSKPAIHKVDRSMHSLVATSKRQGNDDGYVVAEIANFAESADSAAPDVPKRQFLRSRHSHIQQNTNVQNFATEVERFGPRNCISTWRNSVGHCMLQTKCASHDLDNVDVGLICVGTDGDETRHLFGKDSFDDDEQFDTLITCSRCTALRHAKNNQQLSEQLQVLSDGIKELETGMKGIAENVQRLNAKVFPTTALTQTQEDEPIRRVRNAKASLSQSDGKGAKDIGDDSSSDVEESDVQKTDEELEAQEEEEAKQREQEEHERDVEDRRQKKQKAACEQGNEFNFSGDC